MNIQEDKTEVCIRSLAKEKEVKLPFKENCLFLKYNIYTGIEQVLFFCCIIYISFIYSHRVPLSASCVYL